MVNISIPSLGEKFKDYRQGILGDSFNWGPVINARNIDALTYHHSVTKQTAKNDGNWKAECDVIASLHVNGNKWAGVGYRFIICSDGTVVYVGDLSRGGSAVANENDHMFSVCFVGDFTKELPTASQIHSAHLLAQFFLTQMPQYPNLKDWNQIYGHKDWMATACPGTNWHGISGMRDRIINDFFDGYPNPQPYIPEPPVQINWEEAYKKELALHEDTLEKLHKALDDIEDLEEALDECMAKPTPPVVTPKPEVPSQPEKPEMPSNFIKLLEDIRSWFK